MSDEYSYLEDSSLDALFGLLSHRRRRELLVILSRKDGPQTIADLAKMIATRDWETDGEDIPREEIKPIYLELYHAHIPKLAKHGVVDFEEFRERVRLTEQAAALTNVLEFIGEEKV